MTNSNMFLTLSSSLEHHRFDLGFRKMVSALELTHYEVFEPLIVKLVNIWPQRARARSRRNMRKPETEPQTSLRTQGAHERKEAIWTSIVMPVLSADKASFVELGLLGRGCASLCCLHDSVSSDPHFELRAKTTESMAKPCSCSGLTLARSWL